MSTGPKTQRDHTAETLTQQVKRANREFYDLAAGVYEEADGRRDDRFASFLDARLARLGALAGTGRLLDLGCGTGFVAGRASALFDSVVGLDISPSILRQAAAGDGVSLVAGDSDQLPFAAGSFNGIAAVAVLHHLLEHDALAREAYRVLADGGVLYTDHDIEGRFCKNFRLPLGLYRKFRDEEKTYREACPALTHELYELTEVHRDGVDTDAVVLALETAGFSEVKVICHWLGLSPWFDRLGRALNPTGAAPRGFAPSFSIWARK